MPFFIEIPNYPYPTKYPIPIPSLSLPLPTLHLQGLHLQQAGDAPPPPLPFRTVEGVGDRRGVQGSLPGLHPRRQQPPIPPLQGWFAQVLSLRFQLTAPARHVSAPLATQRLCWECNVSKNVNIASHQLGPHGQTTT